MTLEESGRIDIVSRSPDGTINLDIVSVGNWSEDDHMVGQLEVKLENYVGFARGPQFEERFGVAPVKIRLSTSHELTKAANKVVKRASRKSRIPIEVELNDYPPLYGEGIKRPRRPQVRER